MLNQPVSGPKAGLPAAKARRRSAEPRPFDQTEKYISNSIGCGVIS